MDIDMNELRRRRDEINMLSAQAKWAPTDENGCTITYLRVRPGTLGNGLSEGICFAYDCQKRKAKEHPRLRKGTKHYTSFPNAMITSEREIEIAKIRVVRIRTPGSLFLFFFFFFFLCGLFTGG